MFEDLRGQVAAKQFLGSLIKGQRIPHGLLFFGPPKVGKYTAARSFVKAINCRNSKRSNCLCTSCRKIDGDLHPDVKIIQPNDKGRIAIDQIRELEASFQFRRNEGVRKVALVRGAHNLNQQSANALLKTLEEPSEDTSIILTTSKPSAIYETIRSRCQGVRFSFLADDDVEALAEINGLDPDPVALAMMAGSFSPENIRSNLIMLKHIWDGGVVDLPDKIEPDQVKSELTYLAAVFTHLLRTGQFQHGAIVIARATTERLTSLISATEIALQYVARGVKPFLVIQWYSNRCKEVLV